MYNNCPECGSFNSPGTEYCDCGYRFEVAAFKKNQAKSRSDQLLFSLLKVGSTGAMALGALVFIITLAGRDSWPNAGDIQPEIYREPIQHEQNVPDPFDVQQNDVTYRITPRFNYELTGLVVSNHHSDSLNDVLHERWNDFLNIKDLCVVWGTNVETGIFRELTYSSGNFTCFCKWRDRSIGSRFNINQFSNNHLLADDSKLKRAILGVRNGDQILLKGFLCKYENFAVGFSRNTSTTRSDTGNGACETIYVTDFQVLKQANLFKRILFQVSRVVFIGGLILFISLAFLFPKQK